MLDDSTKIDYRGHVLVARRFPNGVVKGQIWLDNKKGGHCEGVTLQGVIKTLREVIDTNLVKKRQVSPQADAYEYTWAMRKIGGSITVGQRAMLCAHYHAPNRILTATQLAKAASYATYGAANLQYGILGRMISDLLYTTQIMHEYSGEPIWTFAIATGPAEKFEDTPQWEWALRPQVAEAMEILGLHNRTSKTNR